jgi:hypothetical protein
VLSMVNCERYYERKCVECQEVDLISAMNRSDDGGPRTVKLMRAREQRPCCFVNV